MKQKHNNFCSSETVLVMLRIHYLIASITYAEQRLISVSSPLMAVVFLYQLLLV